MAILLESDSENIELSDSTLVFALDETGHEEFRDGNYQVYGLGGCGFLVRDYQRLIETPFNFICEKHFPNVIRPFHLTNIAKTFTREQAEALNYYFETFMFFRIARTITIKANNEPNIDNIRLITGSLINAIRDISQQAYFDRIFVIAEDSQRTGNKVMSGLTGYKINDGKRNFDIELALMPKKIINPALEIADIIINTAGRQTRNRMNGKTNFLSEFEYVFKKVDSRLVSFMEITNVRQK